MPSHKIQRFIETPQRRNRMDKSKMPTISRARQLTLTSGRRHQAPLWVNKLSGTKTHEETPETISKLCNLSFAAAPPHELSPAQNDLSEKIREFIDGNLHKGITLKMLAQFLGYSEKYCSELFHSAIGESFSRYLKRRKTDTAALLLRTTHKSIADIAFSLGFSDQFAFSHFFKRTTGQSPRDFRGMRARRHPFQTQFPPLRETR